MKNTHHIFESKFLDDLNRCESTQDVMMNHLESIPEDTNQIFWVRTFMQTKGRGRQQSSWLSTKPGDQLLCSVGLKNQSIKNLGPMISLFAGMALYSSLLELDEDLKNKIFIKWPNDLYGSTDSSPVKLAGILCEQKKANRTVIGFGINLLSHPKLPDQKTDHLLSFTKKINHETFRDLLYLKLIKRFESEINSFVKNPELYKANLITTLREEAMKGFFAQDQIVVMGKPIKPLKLNDNGSLDAILYPSHEPITLI